MELYQYLYTGAIMSDKCYLDSFTKLAENYPELLI